MDEREARRSGYPLTIPDALLQSEAMRQACATRNFREIFRLVNRRTGSSHAVIAAAVGKMTSSRVSDIIRGVRGIRGQGVIERVADGLGIPGEMLGLPKRSWEGLPRSGDSPGALPGPDQRTAHVDPTDALFSKPPNNATAGWNYLDAGDLDDMIRREFLQLVSIAGTLTATPPQNPTERPQSHPIVSRDFADDCERMNSHLWQVFSLSSSKRTAYPLVRNQLGGLTDSLKKATRQKDHRRLCAAAGNLFQIAGEIFFDSNRYMDAAHCYTLAATASKEAGQYDLWACALTRHAFVEMYEHQFDNAASLLEAASHIAQCGDRQLTTRYWVAAVQAEVFAKTGDFDSCRRSLDKSEQVQTLTGDIHNSGWLRFDGSRLAEERGTCYVALGRPDLADVALRDALKQPLSPRRRGGVLVDLATLGIQRRDIDQLTSYTHAALELAQQSHSGYVEKRLQSLQTQMTPLVSNKNVLNLSEQISTLHPAS